MELSKIAVGDKLARKDYEGRYSLIQNRSAVTNAEVCDVVGYLTDPASMDVTALGVVVRVSRDPGVTRVSFVGFPQFSIGAFDDAIEFTSHSIGNGSPFVILHRGE